MMTTYWRTTSAAADTNDWSSTAAVCGNYVSIGNWTISATDNGTAANGNRSWCISPGWTYDVYTCIDIDPQPARKETRKEKRERQEAERVATEQAEQRRLEYQRQQEELRKEQEAAVARAEELLREHVGEKAFTEMYELGYIEVDSHKHKGRKYRIPAENEGFIEVVDKDGKVIDRLCVHAAIICPMPDKVLTRLMLLELAEDTILQVANSHGGVNWSGLVRAVH